MNFDLSLYLVTDRSLSGGRSLEWIIEQAIRGGITMVQLREKNCNTREFTELATKLRQKLNCRNIPLIINDRVDVALASGADGLHIGQSDMPYAIARRLIGPDKIIGLSVENMQEVKEANQLDVDYIGISPVFSTNTKTDTCQPFGIDGIREVAALTKHKTVAIGGISAANARQIVEAGADGIAVVSAIISAGDPEDAARQLKKQIQID